MSSVFKGILIHHLEHSEMVVVGQENAQGSLGDSERG
jgi:hypothetical protein